MDLSPADIVRLVWRDRQFVVDDGVFVFADGLPGPTPEEIEAARAQAMETWQAEQPAPQWDNAQDFMAAFTMPEKAQIALSGDATIAALRLELSTWLSAVHPSDARVQAGLNRLVELGIITAERKTEIINTAH